MLVSDVLHIMQHALYTLHVFLPEAINHLCACSNALGSLVEIFEVTLASRTRALRQLLT